MQTPQVFDLQKIKQAYSQIGNNSYADDAAVMENAGYPISTVMGNAENIKITTPFDLKWAEVLWALRQ
ncbi:hypothetical protein FACS1894156_9250 [Bacteroidia bacterium]|nr:hypothetical protein FACS1894156_9250 [Bacteroidia bacterium]